jgi:hypothetical protein
MNSIDFQTFAAIGVLVFSARVMSKGLAVLMTVLCLLAQVAVIVFEITKGGA